MATFIYKDIDLSLEKNITDDFPILTDVDAIKKTIYNNLMINSAERYFDNSPRMDIRDAIHSPDDFITRKQIEDAVREATVLDSRVVGDPKDFRISFNDELAEVEITFSIVLRQSIDESKTVDISLVFARE